MLYFVRVRERQQVVTDERSQRGEDFLLAAADDEQQLRAMIEDDYTEIVELTTDVEGALYEQYDDMALLCTR